MFGDGIKYICRLCWWFIIGVSDHQQGYNCDGGKAGEFFDKSRAALEPFVEKLNLSVSDEEEEE